MFTHGLIHAFDILWFTHVFTVAISYHLILCRDLNFKPSNEGQHGILSSIPFNNAIASYLAIVYYQLVDFVHPQYGNHGFSNGKPGCC